jgi:phage terminase Nu1 subunit (DNA packaging protein)
VNKRTQAKHKREALRLLERARKTAKLRRIPKAKADDVDAIFLRDGTRYEEIMDDVDELRGELASAHLTLADIGTDETELAKLKKASDRLNEPHRLKMSKRESGRRMNDFGEDDA